MSAKLAPPLFAQSGGKKDSFVPTSRFERILADLTKSRNHRVEHLPMPLVMMISLLRGIPPNSSELIVFCAGTDSDVPAVCKEEARHERSR